MKVKEITERLNLENISESGNMESDITGCFAGDLLSLAMSSVQNGNIWITVQTNLNILAIASLTEAACIIVANSMNIPETVVEKAKEEDICLLRSDKDVYELCNLVGDIL